MEKTRILYNPYSLACQFELGNYQRYAKKHGLPMQFEDIYTTDLKPWGLTKDEAIQNLHVMNKGEVIKGVPAIMILWELMPKYKIGIKIVKIPAIWRLSNLFFDKLLMPFFCSWAMRRETKLGSHVSA